MIDKEKLLIFMIKCTALEENVHVWAGGIARIRCTCRCRKKHLFIPLYCACGLPESHDSM